MPHVVVVPLTGVLSATDDTVITPGAISVVLKIYYLSVTYIQV
jgi:hypothetical protein